MHRLFKCCNCFHLLFSSKPHINNWVKEEKYSKKPHHDYIFRRHFEYYPKHAHNYCKCCKYISEHSPNIVKNMIHLEIIKCFLCDYALGWLRSYTSRSSRSKCKYFSVVAIEECPRNS